jgi:hypothetical protein
MHFEMRTLELTQAVKLKKANICPVRLLVVMINSAFDLNHLQLDGFLVAFLKQFLNQHLGLVHRREGLLKI